MKLAYKIVALLLSICPLLQADDTDIGAYGHVVSNKSGHAVHVHLDIAGSDAEKVLNPGASWRTGKTGKINKWEVRDYESGMWVANVKPDDGGGKYQVLFIEPGPNSGKYKGYKSITPSQVKSRYKYIAKRLHDRF